MSWTAPFEELRAGWQFATAGRTVGEHDVVAFGTLTGDRHPQHLDADWAAAGPFGERVAHGMLVLSHAVGLVPFAPERVLALRAVRDAVFKRPVRFGDTIAVRGQLTGTKDIDDRCGLVRCRLRVVNQRDELCCRAELELLWSRGTVEAA